MRGLPPSVAGGAADMLGHARLQCAACGRWSGAPDQRSASPAEQPPVQALASTEPLCSASRCSQKLSLCSRALTAQRHISNGSLQRAGPLTRPIQAGPRPCRKLLQASECAQRLCLGGGWIIRLSRRSSCPNSECTQSSRDPCTHHTGLRAVDVLWQLAPSVTKRQDLLSAASPLRNCAHSQFVLWGVTESQQAALRSDQRHTRQTRARGGV